MRSGRAWPENDNYTAKMRLDTWQRVVESYSRRRLTFAKDKLPAIAGLANAVQRVVGCEYLAGLWRDNMLNGLLWQRSGSGTVHDEQEKGVYYAPSWSWASVNFPVTYINISEADEAEVLDVESNSDGVIKVRLRAKVLQVPGKSATFIPDDLDHDTLRTYTVCVLRSAETILPEMGGREGKQMVQHYRAGGGFGLVLSRVEGGETWEFRRVGMVELVPVSMTEGVEAQEIVLV